MPLVEANRLAATCGKIRGYGKALHRDQGARGNEVPLLRCSQHGHPARTHLSQSRVAGELAPTASPRDLPNVKAARNCTPSGERRTVHCRQEPADGHRHKEKRSSGRSEPGIHG